MRAKFVRGLDAKKALNVGIENKVNKILNEDPVDYNKLPDGEYKVTHYSSSRYKPSESVCIIKIENGIFFQASYWNEEGRIIYIDARFLEEIKNLNDFMNVFHISPDYRKIEFYKV